MGLALNAAREAAQAKETPVGAALLNGHGQVLAVAGNAPESLKDPTAHAEILALREACRKTGNYRLEGCVLAVTLEPCLMCAGALAHARVAGLVYGARDPAAGAVESCMEALDLPFLNHRVWHMGGVCGTESAELLRAFFRERR